MNEGSARRDGPSPPATLIGVLLGRAPGGRLPADATPLETTLYGLLDVPRTAVALCATSPLPPRDVASALRRLLDVGAIRARRAIGVTGRPFPAMHRLPKDPHVDSPATRCPTLTGEELRIALEAD